MQYILHNKGCGNVSYVQITAGGSLKKVRERSLATIFQSQSEADNIKHKYKKKLKTYKLEPITVQNIEPVKTAEQECKRKSVSKTLRTQVYNLAEGHCAICGDFVPYEDFTVDHIFPVSKGGKNELSNLQCTCKSCNTMKQNMSKKEFQYKIGKIFLRQTIKRIKDRKKEK